MEPDLQFPADLEPEVIPAARPERVEGALRPANEVALERLAPSSPVLRRRAFSSLLRVLLSGRGEL